jgi:hypothetical protein
MADPTIPKWRGQWSRDSGLEVHIMVPEGQAFDGRDYGTLNRFLARVPRQANMPGRPEWPSWKQMMEARDALIAEDPRGGTQERVAEELGCSINTVKTRAKNHGGWPRG